MISLTKLKPEEQAECLQKIGKELCEFAVYADQESIETLLAELEILLDELSDDDFFGTEGWRHFFNLER